MINNFLCSRSSEACQVADCAEARHKEVRAANDGDKARKSIIPLRHGLRLDSKGSAARGMVADNRIGIVIEPVKMWLLSQVC